MSINFVEDTGRDREVFVDPRGVPDGRDLDWREIVVSKAPAFGLGPCECLLVELEDVLDKLDFFGPKKVVLVDVEVVEAFLDESRAGRERRERSGSSGRCRIFGEGGGDRMDLLGGFFVCAGGDEGVL